LRGRQADCGWVALDAGFFAAYRPVDDDLWLRQQKRIGAIDRPAQSRRFVVRPGLRAGGVPSNAYQHSGSHDGKKNDDCHEREESNFMLNDAAMRVQHKLLERQGRLLGRAGRRRQYRADGCDPSANSLPAPPKAASVRRDPVRHAPLPQPVVTVMPAVRRGRTRESLNFTLKRIRAERVQIVNATLEAQLLQRSAFLRRLLERLRVARHVFNIDAGERIAELMLGSG